MSPTLSTASDPKLRVVIVREAISAARAGDKAKSRTLFRQVIDADPQNETAWLWLANVAASPAEAVEALRAVLRMNSQNETASTALPDALLRAGVAACKAGDRPGAAAYLADATRLAPTNETAWMWRAQAENDPNLVIEYLNRVLKINPDNATAKHAIVQVSLKMSARWVCPVCAQTGGTPAGNVCPKCGIVAGIDRPDVFDAPVPSVNRAAVEAAARQLHAAWKAAPTAEAAFGLGLAYLNLGFTQQGIKALQSACQSKGGKPVWKDQLARLEARLQSAGRYTPAQEAAPRPRVMVVDDSPTVRRLVSVTLAASGYEVIEANDADHAAKVLRDAGAPQLFILDVNMPGMDGFELCKLLQGSDETAKIPVMFLTGKDGLLSKLQGRWVGAADYLTKPFRPEKLLAAVERLVPLEAK